VGVLVWTAHHREAEKKAHNIPVTLQICSTLFPRYIFLWCEEPHCYHKLVTKVIAINDRPGTDIFVNCNCSSTVHIYTQTIHRTTQLIWEECGPCPIFASYTLAFALQLRKKHGKTSVRVAEEIQLAR
jgi:hypothetical protein